MAPALPSGEGGVGYEDHHEDHYVRRTFNLVRHYCDTGDRCVQTTHGPMRYSYRIEKVSKENTLTVHPYALDKNLEWVVDTKSRRVCWLPPGYVSEIENGHFFVGSSVVMVGQGGIVRRLTFRDWDSDS